MTVKKKQEDQRNLELSWLSSAIQAGLLGWAAQYSIVGSERAKS